MPATKQRITITLPAEVMGRLAARANGNRSAFIAEAIAARLKELERLELEADLREGYIAMGELNRRMAEATLPAFAETLNEGDWGE
jgi:metal-responsive CopG/Arc/MetJ family transcriptional regulator